MVTSQLRSPGTARKALAGVRIVMGTAGLVAPGLMLRRLGVDTARDRSATYPFRMFGIRTIVIGADLLLLQGEDLRRASRIAVLIHATDTVSAATTAIKGDLPRRQAILATSVSAVNTALAVAALRR